MSKSGLYHGSAGSAWYRSTHRRPEAFPLPRMPPRVIASRNRLKRGKHGLFADKGVRMNDADANLYLHEMGNLLFSLGLTSGNMREHEFFKLPASSGRRLEIKNHKRKHVVR